MTWMPVSLFELQGPNFVFVESTVLTRLLEAVSTIQLGSCQVSSRSIGRLDHPIIKCLYPSVQFNHGEGFQR